MSASVANRLFRYAVDQFKRYQILRFVVVGSMNTAFSYGVYSCVLFLGFGFQIANLTALVLGVLFSFRTQGALVFFNRDTRLIFRFVFGWGVIYLATIAVIAHLLDLGLNAYLAGALAVPFSTVLSYLTQKYFVFRVSNLSIRRE